MKCPKCGALISNEIIKSEGARLMVNSRPDRKKIKDKHAAARAKIRELTEKLAELEGKRESKPKRTKGAISHA